MKKTKKIFFSFVMATVILVATSFSVSAHDLTPWVNHYPPNMAGGNYQFAFGNVYHMQSSTIKYYWTTSAAKTHFQSAMNDVHTMWGKKINPVETSSSTTAHLKITYNPDTTGNRAYITLLVGSEKHYAIGGNGTGKVFPEVVMTYGNANDSYLSQPAEKRFTMAHELGHAFGITDLYGYSASLDSMYSHRGFTEATRHDKNAMNIALGNPWFINWDDKIYNQNSPGNWSYYRKLGDANNDGSVSMKDIMLMQNHVAHTITLTDVDFIAADVNLDGTVGMKDILMVQNYIAGVINNFV